MVLIERKKLEQLLEALEARCGTNADERTELMPALRAALTQPVRGVRVEGDTVIISVKGGNEAARNLCHELIKEMET